MASTQRRRLGWLHSAPVIACVLASALLPSVAGCTDDPEKNDGEPDPVALEIELVQGGSGLTSQERDQLQADIGDVISEYIVNAFLGDYPRDDFVRSLESFTSGAAEKAARDLALLTGSGFGSAEAVEARSLVARITAFAPEGEALGATARVAFEFGASDDEGEEQGFTLVGRLMLAPDGDSWKIFGYDVRRNDLSSAEEGSS
jgi:hypothetical protein